MLPQHREARQGAHPSSAEEAHIHPCDAAAQSPGLVEQAESVKKRARIEQACAGLGIGTCCLPHQTHNDESESV